MNASIILILCNLLQGDVGPQGIPGYTGRPGDPVSQLISR